MKSLAATGAGLTLALTCWALVRAAPAKPAPSPAAAIARLKADEAAIKSGRLTLLVTLRRGEPPAGTKPATARDAALKAPLIGQSREYVVFSGANWKREATVMSPQGEPQGRVLVGFRDKVGRTYREQGGEKAGAVGLKPTLGAPESVLLSRSTTLLDGVTWTSAKWNGSQLVLSGKRETAQVTLALRTTPRYAVERMTLSQQSTTPSGAVSHGEEIRAAYETAGGGLVLKSLEASQYAIGAVNELGLAAYKVEGAQLNEAVKPEELEIAFPMGTQVVDRRVDPPASYLFDGRELTLAEARALSERAASNTARVGKPAPEWELKTLDGKSAKLADYRGKVVLLTWFASW